MENRGDLSLLEKNAIFKYKTTICEKAYQNSLKKRNIAMAENLTYHTFKEPATRLSGNKQPTPITRTHKYVQVAKAKA